MIPARPLKYESLPYFLAKTEPATYSIDTLASDLETIWDGVTNPQAVKAIRSMRTGDRVFIYHTGGQTAIAGLAEVTGNPQTDPTNPRSATVPLRYLAHINPPVSLVEIRQTGQFDDWSLLRQGRLSTMAVPDEFVRWIRERYPSLSI